jgi:hypothetical protein
MTKAPRPPSVGSRLATPTILTPTSRGVSGGLPIYVAPPPGPPEVRFRDPLAGHLADVSALELCITPPAGWLAVRERWAALVGVAFPCRDRLAQALVKGGGDLAELRALALAETQADTGAEVELRRHVGAVVHGELTALWAPVAHKAYERIAHLLNNAAKTGDDAALDELLPVLVAAARLCGADPDVAQHATHRLGLSLAVDPRRAHRRRLVEAFPNWARIRELGAGIRANDDPRAQPWRLPELVRCFDADHVLRDHDPLDGPPPRGWKVAGDGWADEQVVWRT